MNPNLHIFTSICLPFTWHRLFKRGGIISSTRASTSSFMGALVAQNKTDNNHPYRVMTIIYFRQRNDQF